MNMVSRTSQRKYTPENPHQPHPKAPRGRSNTEIEKIHPAQRGANQLIVNTVL